MLFNLVITNHPVTVHYCALIKSVNKHRTIKKQKNFHPFVPPSKEAGTEILGPTAQWLSNKEQHVSNTYSCASGTGVTKVTLLTR